MARSKKAAAEAQPRGYNIKLVSLAIGVSSTLEGRYVEYYHPGPTAFRRWECLLRTTRHQDKAQVYATKEAALDEWNRVDPREPVDVTGKANRPMTAWTIEIVPAP